MARIAGVDLQDNLKVDYALTNIKGIGRVSSKEILDELSIDSGKRMSDLSGDEISSIASKLEDYMIEGDLQKRTRSDIQRLRVIGTYRGQRHSKGLPVRGQRTRSNARQKRGAKKTVGSYKKDVLSQMKTSAPKSEEDS